MRIGLFPKQVKTVRLNIPKEYIKKELSKNVDLGGPTLVPFIVKGAPFSGEAVGEKYSILLKTSYKNSFKPEITVTLFEHDNKTEIKTEYKLLSIIKGTMFFFIAIAIFMQSSLLYKNLDNVINNFNIFYISPILFIIALLLLSRVGFYMSMSHSEAILVKILKIARNKYRKSNNHK